ncbi:potassium channel family protein [Streptomyces sp. NPDC049954]|uniref:potassium channel family protein n=1 Tax=Streptomyces sp. NPDC049954 TaxID=3155779 RepID=UPI00341A58B5
MHEESRPPGRPHREAPLSLAALVFLVAYSVRVLVRDLPGWGLDLCLAAIALAWATAALDYAARWRRSGDGRRFVRRHPLNTLIVVLPLLRPLAFVRVYEAVQRRRGRPLLSVPARVVTYTGIAVLALGYTCALTVYALERDAPGASIRSFGQAVWWACATLGTVGYGDAVPVTGWGRTVAVFLMACGIALLGAVTGAFSTWLLGVFGAQDPRAAERDEDAAVRDADRPPQD